MEAIIILLSLIFLVLVFTVCGRKGLRLLLSLLLTFLALIFLITPIIVKGYSPEWVVLIVGFPIVAFIVYLSEGWKALSHLSVASVALNFILISLLTYASVKLAGLSGLTTTDTSFLGLTGVNLQALLIAGIMLGTLGILTEMVVTQIATIMEFKNANPKAERTEIYARTYSIGISHLGSIINTLFLVYAGVSFPLLIIYAGSHSGINAALNYEPLASEIIRMLCGTIGLIIAMPVSTRLAIWRLDRKSKLVRK